MINVQVAEGWQDYELIDSGESQKLERWGQFLTVRPDPRAIWSKMAAEVWKKATAIYLPGETTGEWKFINPPPEPWIVHYEQMKFKLKPTNFRHVGLFPEQAVNWSWIGRQVRAKPEIKVLNLFAYTGGATIAAAQSGARVTHVDASRPAMMWASENAKLSETGQDKIRWIQDDAGKFVEREIRRGEKYDAIIMDPPKFGRGTKKEVWKLLEDLPRLLQRCREVMSKDFRFWLINAYAADMSSLVLDNLAGEMTGDLGGKRETGELGLRETSGGRILPAGIFTRWSCGGI